MSHKRNLATLIRQKRKADEAMQAFNRSMHDTFSDGYGIGWMHAGHVQGGIVKKVLGNPNDKFHPNRLLCWNTRTGNTVEVMFYQVMEYEEHAAKARIEAMAALA